MNSKPVFVVSDIHLGAVPCSTEKAFRDFLAHVQQHGSQLLINGDLFDFWFEYRSVILREHFRVVARLADLVESGVPVSFVGGNHDAWAGDFLQQEVGITILSGPVTLDLAGRRTLIAHGDGVGSGDFKYRALRRIIRHPLTVGAFRSLHPDLGRRVALRASSTEKKAAGGDRGSHGRAEYIQRWAEEQLRIQPDVELVLAGHAHVPLVAEPAPGRYYVNTGDWIRHFTYVVLPRDGGPPQMHRWDPGADNRQTAT